MTKLADLIRSIATLISSLVGLFWTLVAIYFWNYCQDKIEGLAEMFNAISLLQ